MCNLSFLSFINEIRFSICWFNFLLRWCMLSAIYLPTLQCNLFQILHQDSWSGRLSSFFSTMWDALVYMLESSHVSLIGTLVLIMASIFFVPPKLSRKKRITVGVLHVLAHLTAAVILMLLLELSIEICIRNRLLATSGAATAHPFLLIHHPTSPKRPGD